MSNRCATLHGCGKLCSRIQLARRAQDHRRQRPLPARRYPERHGARARERLAQWVDRRRSAARARRGACEVRVRRIPEQPRPIGDQRPVTCAVSSVSTECGTGAILSPMLMTNSRSALLDRTAQVRGPSAPKSAAATSDPVLKRGWYRSPAKPSRKSACAHRLVKP